MEKNNMWKIKLRGARRGLGEQFEQFEQGRRSEKFPHKRTRCRNLAAEFGTKGTARGNQAGIGKQDNYFCISITTEKLEEDAKLLFARSFAIFASVWI